MTAFAVPSPSERLTTHGGSETSSSHTSPAYMLAESRLTFLWSDIDVLTDIVPAHG